jgi:hypothetical protein
MSGRAEVYRPLTEGEIVCTSPGLESTIGAGGVVNARSNQAMPCLYQTAVHLAQAGAIHRSMVRVRVPAGWLWH